jgi:Phosphotransferase enzyme family
MTQPQLGEQARPGATRYPRAARWQPETVLNELAAATGIRLVSDGWCRGGQIGACYVRWADGHRSVLTAGPAGGLEAAERAAGLSAEARAAGVPAPRYELTAGLPSFTAVVQELLPGTAPAAVSGHTVASIVEVIRRCRGLLAERADLPAPSLFLRTDGPGFCLHGAMASYDRRTAWLLAVIEEAGAELPEDLAGNDLVHFDLHPENVLVDGTGHVTGVVDWDGAARSDGALDLMALRFHLARRAPELGDWVGGLLRESVPAPVLLACWAHMSLRLVDWAIRELTADDVDAWLRVATDLMRDYGPVT